MRAEEDFKKFVELGGLESKYFNSDLEELRESINTQLDYEDLGSWLENILLIGNLEDDETLTFDLKFEFSNGCSCIVDLKSIDITWDLMPSNLKEIEDIIICGTTHFYEYCEDCEGQDESNGDCVDNVEKPKHYKLGNGKEVIDLIQDLGTVEDFEAYCKGNIIKYVTRYKYKNGVEDLEKAKVYINYLIKVLKGERCSE